MNHRSQQNRLLASLNSADANLLEPHFKDVALPHGEVLCAPGDVIEFVYFPISGMISAVTRMEDGSGVETGVVGREGAIGTFVVASKHSVEENLVQAQGEARRIPSKAFLRVYNGSDTFRDLINRNLWRLSSSAQQCVACNSLHGLEARLARWLLQTRDRIQSDVLPLTQEFLALMLAAQRSSVATAAGPLKKDKLISIRRGNVRILDAEGLTKRACECYSVLKHRGSDQAA